VLSPADDSERGDWMKKTERFPFLSDGNDGQIDYLCTTDTTSLTETT
jgi:hypothetical protein